MPRYLRNGVIHYVNIFFSFGSFVILYILYYICVIFFCTT